MSGIRSRGGDAIGRSRRGRVAAAPLLAALSLVAAPLPDLARAQEVPAPSPPCGGVGPFPPYAAADRPPQVAVWSERPLDDPGLAHVRLWTGLAPEGRPPPPCAGWDAAPPPPFMIAIAFSFPGEATADELLLRLGAAAGQAGLRYWAASRRRWEELFDQTYAVADPDSRERRPDPAPGELRPGRDLFAFQDPAGPVGGAIYRTRVREAGPDRLVAESENVTTARAAGLFPLRAGTLRFLHVLERSPPDAGGGWAYYGLVGLGTAPDSARTYVNRAAALARHLAGIPPEREPPVWP